MALQLKVLPKGSYKNKVKVIIPQDFDKKEIVDFTAQFKRLTTSEEVDALFKEVRESVTANEATNFDAEILKRVLQGWSGLKGSDDAEIAYSDETRDELLQIVVYRAALAHRFLEDLKPVTETARKN